MLLCLRSICARERAVPSLMNHQTIRPSIRTRGQLAESLDRSRPMTRSGVATDVVPGRVVTPDWSRQPALVSRTMRLSLVHLLPAVIGALSFYLPSGDIRGAATRKLPMTTPIRTEHFALELPGKWHGDTTEKNELSQFWSYQQDDGPGFLTISAMTLQPEAAADQGRRRDALAGIVQTRKRALLQMAGQSLKTGPEQVAENGKGSRSISLSYVDSQNGIIGRFSAQLSGNVLLTGMYYEEAAPTSEPLVQQRAEAVLRQFCVAR
jgi:hypothetical protein